MTVPVVLFVYNRPEHTRKTIEALFANNLANESDLFIYSDAPKDEKVLSAVNAVRSYIKTITGFKSVTIIEREKNWGLANSIIDGVTCIVNKYGKIIVLEDDIVTSPFFLNYMNKALEYYANEKCLWHISGWNYPINPDGIGDAFFWRNVNCWGWATWQDRWMYFEKDVDKLIHSFSRRDIYRFNINGAYDNWGQVLANKARRINTWAIFWSATIFQNNGLCLNPSISLVENIGLDGTGVHCGLATIYYGDFSVKEDICFDNLALEENKLALKKIIKFNRKQKGNLFVRILKKMYHLLCAGRMRHKIFFGELFR
jgi:hypothetical protein